MLETSEVEMSYGHIKALRGVAIKVQKGEIVALIGANGAGKSSFLNTVSGIYRPTKGHIFFKGKDITHLPVNQIAKLGIIQVPEGRAIFKHMTVMENIEMGAYSCKDRGEARLDARRVFEIFPVLEQRKRQIAGTLSGGEQQMLALGRGLMAKPQLLMMDEPSLGLAPIVVEEIFETISLLKKEGLTILLVEQNARKALQCADRGYVLEGGRIVLSGAASELMDNQKVQEAYLGGSKS